MSTKSKFRNNLYQRSLFTKNEGEQWYNDLNSSLIPLFKYLETSIKAEQDRSISAHFEIILDDGTIKLKPLQVHYEISSENNVEVMLDDHWFEIKNKDDLLETYPDFLEITDIKLLYAEAQTFFSVNTEDIRYEKIENIENHEEFDESLFIRLNQIPATDEQVLFKKVTLELRQLFQDPDRMICKFGGEILTIVSFEKNGSKYHIQFEETINNQKRLYIDGYLVDSFECLEKSSVKEIQKVIDLENPEKELYFKRNLEENYISLSNQKYKKLSAYDSQNNEIILKKIPFSTLKEIKIDSTKIILQKVNDNEYSAPNQPKDNDIVIGDDGIEYLCKRIEKKQDSINIRLLDEDEAESDEIARKTPVDYFFEDDVEELMGSSNFYEAKKNWLVFKVSNKGGNQEERILRIKCKKNYENAKKSLEYLIRKNLPLYIHRNTYQLDVQKKFLEFLLERPLPVYRPLLRLGVDKEKTLNEWEEVKHIDVVKDNDWYILEKLFIEGTEAQRNFVNIGLNTPEFAFLEGPPGSGKTTTILELILQLFKRKKRILLAASTHVAVDNILELLKEKFPDLLPGLFPIRIGATWNISESVREFQIEQVLSDSFDKKKTESLSEMDSLLLDCSNLVCGTMVGILQHPRFKNSFKSNVGTYPNFDVLIIDEASKTTFQEFIVPALFAKKWILVGDIKQLAPYAESTYLTRYFENYSRNGSSLLVSNDLQLALFYKFIILNEFLNKKYYNNDNWCIPSELGVLNELKNELNLYYSKITQNNSKKWPFIVFISNRITNNSGAYLQLSEKDLENNSKIITSLNLADVLFIENILLDKFKNLIPNRFLVVGKKNWEFTDQYYSFQNFESRKKGIKLRINLKNPILSNLENINGFLAEKSWGSELSWRLIRMFELRGVEKSSHRYEKPIELLASFSKDLSFMYSNAWSAALPSILEALQEGLSGKYKSSLNSPLKTGMKELITPRHILLKHQMRMHPDISKFSRTAFYQENALIDSKRIKRDWDYEPIKNKPYSSRFTWIDCTDSDQKRKTKNYTEQHIIKNELIRFISWAKRNEKLNEENWTVAIITYYNAQRLIFEKFLQKYTGQENHHSTFSIENVSIFLNTVDKIQGREADIVFLSMVRNKGNKPILGFMDNPNRLNVACTRARYQLVIVGQLDNFSDPNYSDFTAQLTQIATKENHNFQKKENSLQRTRSSRKSNSSSLAFPIHLPKIKPKKTQSNKKGGRNTEYDKCPKCGKSKKRQFDFCFKCDKESKGLVLCKLCNKEYYDPRKYTSCYKCSKNR